MATIKPLNFDPGVPVDKFSSIVYPKPTGAKGVNLKLDKSLGTTIGNALYNPDFSKMGIGQAGTNLDGGTKDKRFDYKGLIEGSLPYASNLINSFRKLPSPTTPQMQSLTSPELVNFDADRARIANQVSTFGKETDYKVNNRAVAQGLKAKSLSDATQNLNQLAQQEGNTNAIIKNQTAQQNQNIISRNLSRQDEFNNQVLSKNLKEQELSADNLANMIDKYQLQKRDNALMDLEGRKIDTISKAYEKDQSGTSVYDRNLKDLSIVELMKLYRRSPNRLKTIE